MSDVLQLTCDLIARASVTPDDTGCQALIAGRLAQAGFACEHLRFGEVDNLWATHGDGDGPVLAGADVSFALGDGNALAARAADLVLAAPNLLRIPQAIVLARRTRAVIRQNLAWALAYNLLALPAAALGMVSPWQAALGMAMSSLLVTANALRLARVPAP